MPTEIIAQIFEICIIPILAILTRYLIKYLQSRSDELSAATDDKTTQKYISMITSTVESCVIATNQTYVDSLKQQGKFDAEAQKIAFDKTLAAVLAILSEDAKKYIQESTSDINVYLTQLIESSVNANKTTTTKE